MERRGQRVRPWCGPASLAGRRRWVRWDALPLVPFGVLFGTLMAPSRSLCSVPPSFPEIGAVCGLQGLLVELGRKMPDLARKSSVLSKECLSLLGWGWSSVVECLPGIHQTLRSIPTLKKKKKGGGRKGRKKEKEKEEGKNQSVSITRCDRACTSVYLV